MTIARQERWGLDVELIDLIGHNITNNGYYIKNVENDPGIITVHDHTNRWIATIWLSKNTIRAYTDHGETSIQLADPQLNNKIIQIIDKIKYGHI